MHFFLLWDHKAIAGILGATISEVTSGKFANGAQTGAFQFLLNQSNSFGTMSKLSKLNELIELGVYKDMIELKAILNDTSGQSDVLIDYLEQNGYIEGGEWDVWRGIDRSSHSNRALSFNLRGQEVYDNLRTNYSLNVLLRISREIGNIYFDQFDYVPHVKNAFVGVNPNKFEQTVWKFADDAAGAVQR